MKVGAQTRIGKVLPGSRYLEAVKPAGMPRFGWLGWITTAGAAGVRQTKLRKVVGMSIPAKLRKATTLPIS